MTIKAVLNKGKGCQTQEAFISDCTQWWLNVSSRGNSLEYSKKYIFPFVSLYVFRCWDDSFR